ncbi:MAG: glycoside hydrolase family 9 protein [Candidatus Hydrogenedentes bacterium]|nr:glycoside hydrolase family 9 protein [Candidatus Hydrogenedentota bacterium]
MFTSILTYSTLLLSILGAPDPEVVWRYNAQSNLYAAPVVADVHPHPGSEVVISDSEAKRLRCIGANGVQLWEYAGNWKQRLVSAAAVSGPQPRDAAGTPPLLAIANEDGTVHCVEGASGTPVWVKPVGAVEWGGVLWADLTGDKLEELVVGTERQGVTALDARGNELWRYRGDVAGEEFNIQCPLAAADVTGDGKAEVFGCEQRGPFALDEAGHVLWRHRDGDDFLSTVLVTRVEEGGAPDLFCLSRDDSFLWRLDARHGTVRWRAPLVAAPEVYAGSAMAAGDLNCDGLKELVVGDGDGHVYAFSAAGEELWTFSTSGPLHVAPVLANVDDDDYVEVLAASGDHRLYCLSFDGRLLWQFETGLRVTAPASVADLDGDGLTDILLCGSDRTLYRLGTGSAYVRALAPWPARGHDAAQSGHDLSTGDTQDYNVIQTSLLENGGFEKPKVTENALAHPKTAAMEQIRAQQPRGWRAVDPAARYLLDTEDKAEGERSLRVEGTATVISERLPVGPGWLRVDATARCRGAGTISLRWYGANGLLSEHSGIAPTGPIVPIPPTQDPPAVTWNDLTVEGIVPPFRARGLEIALTSSAPGPAWWDDVQVRAFVRERRRGEVLVNQVGYDAGAPKSFVVQANFEASVARFAVFPRNEQTPVFEGTLHAAGRITGRYGSDWGHQYWRGEFSALEAPGEYVVRTWLDGTGTGQEAPATVELTSSPFGIGPESLWRATARAAYRFFYYQRCGMAIPGFHEACHLDDSTGPDGQGQYELWGGWHDAGDYNKYHNAPYVAGLARAYALAREAFRLQDENDDGTDDFLDEILWGAAHVRRMLAPDGSAYGQITNGYGYFGAPELETDNVPGTGDERPIRGALTGNDPSEHHAALARVATFVAEPAPWVAAAERGLHWALDHGQRGLAQFSTAVDLYIVTHDEQYARLARELIPAPSAAPEVVDALVRYDGAIGEDHRDALRDVLVAEAEKMLTQANNVFGVYTFGSADAPNFFNPPADGGGWHVGTSSYLLQAATRMALAYQYQPEVRYLQFVYDQFNWTLGLNPFNVSLMEGQGSTNLPTYHHRYAFSGVARGAVPGGVVNGVTWRGVGDDRPFLDLSGVDIPDYASNEVWLPHNTNYLNALVQLRVTSYALGGGA